MSYSQYTYNRNAYAPEAQQYGDIIAVKKPTGTYYTLKGSSVSAKDKTKADLPPAENTSYPGEFTNALGAGGSDVKAEQEKRRELQKRFEENLEMEKAGMYGWLDSTGHLNGQARQGIAEMLFGPSIDEKTSSPFLRKALHEFNDKTIQAYPFGSVANAGCEAIAVFNTLHDLGKDVSLSQIIYDTERNGGMLWNGWFGTKTFRVDDILKLYGVESIVMNDPRYIEKAAMHEKIKDGQVFVVSAFNEPKGLLSGIHTCEIVYSPSQNPNEPWTVYNLNPDDTEGKHKATFSEIFEGADIQINVIKMEEEP